MKKVIFIVSVLALLWGCKKEKVEPVEIPQFESGNKKIKYSISQTEGSSVVTKSTYTWNQSGRLTEISSYVDSNNAGYRLYEKRNLEFNGKYVSKYILSNFNKDNSLYSQSVNDYTYQDDKLISYTSHDKTYNSGNGFHDYTNSYMAQYSNDSLIYYVTSFVSNSMSSNFPINPSDTTFVKFLEKSNSKKDVYYYKEFFWGDGGIYKKYGTEVLLDKNLNILSFISLNDDDLPRKKVFTLEFTELNDPLSDLVFYGTGTVLWARLIDDWLFELNMEKLYKRILTEDKIVYNYEHVINANGLLTKTNVIVTDSLGNSKTNTTTFFY